MLLGDSDKDTLLLYGSGRLYSRSEAVLRIVSALPAPWSLLRFCRVMPRFLRDAVYKFIAKNRRRLFRQRACFAPTADERDRFLAE